MGTRLLPRNLLELFSYSLALEREATRCFAELEGFVRGLGDARVADELSRIGREEREQYELIELGTAGRALPELAGWELAWHNQGSLLEAGRAPRTRREALAMALALERRTRAFYADVAENARDDAVRAFSAEMAQDEERHVARLEALLDREPDPAVAGPGEAPAFSP